MIKKKFENPRQSALPVRINENRPAETPKMKKKGATGDVAAASGHRRKRRTKGKEEKPSEKILN